MQSTLSFGSILALFGAMVVLAALPSVSVLAVSTRSASAGFLHGALTAAGIVLGDLIFIAIALWGLSFLTETLGGFSSWIKYLGGAYLIFLGVSLWRSQAGSLRASEAPESSLLSSFLAGLSITLADQKATLFYLGFFPAFLDLSQISYADTAIIAAVTIFAVGGVKLIYAFLADRARSLISPTASQSLNRLAGIILIAVGAFLIFKP
jgi:threonine/homoserine/homoserine lactone efflux protein